jgi:hypothetical protein
MQGEASDRLTRPWFYVLLEAVPGPTAFSIAAIAVGLAILNASLFAIGRWLAPSLALERDVTLEIFLGQALTVYAIWANWFTTAGSARDLDRLRPVVTLPAHEFERLARAATHHPQRSLRIATLAGIAMPPFVALLTLPPSQWSALGIEATGLVAMRCLLWSVLGPVLYGGFVTVRIFWLLGREHIRIDLLDLDALGVFARLGLRLMLVLLGAAIFFAPGAALAASFETSSLLDWVVVLLSLPWVLLGLATLLIPSWGLRHRIRDAKLAELARVNAALAGDAGALDSSPIGRDAGRLTAVDLLAYRDRVEALREWPIDASVVGRLGLYLLIPLASWVGAALVERLVDRLFRSGGG